MNLNSKFDAEWSFLKPELLSIEEEVLREYVEELEDLKVYKFKLEKLNKKTSSYIRCRTRKNCCYGCRGFRCK